MISIVALLLLFSIIAILVNNNNNLVIDSKVYEIISKFEGNSITNVFKTLTYLGNAKMVAIFCVITLLLDKSKTKVALPITLAVMMDAIVNILLKNAFQRPRPSLEQLVLEKNFSFPSGHAMVTATIFSMLIYLSYKYIKRKNMRICSCSVCILLIILVGISRIYLRVHYFSDILAGWTLGIVITLIIIYIMNIFEKNKSKNV